MTINLAKPLLPNSWKPIVSVAFALMIVSPVDAQEAERLRLVADGKPWRMVQRDGMTGEITFQPGGKATMQSGSRTLAPSWRAGENGKLCIKPMPIIPERCVDLRRDGRAVVGTNQDGEQFRLSR